jgi:hypothetical protein
MAWIYIYVNVNLNVNVQTTSFLLLCLLSYSAAWYTGVSLVSERVSAFMARFLLRG